MDYKINSHKGQELLAYRRGRNMGLLIGLAGIILLGLGNIILINGL